MDKEKLKRLAQIVGNKLTKGFRFLKEYCNNYIFSTGIIITGLCIFMLNILRVGFYNPFILGVLFIGLHFFYNRNWIFSLAGSLLMSIGIFVILLFSYILPDGGESAIILAIGLGFIIFYGIEGRWLNFWPLIPGIPISTFGLLVYWHQTGQYYFRFLDLFFKIWPLAIVIFGISTLFSKKIKQKIPYFKNKAG